MKANRSIIFGWIFISVSLLAMTLILMNCASSQPATSAPGGGAAASSRPARKAATKPAISEKEKTAREALKKVGTDEEATTAWEHAINDASFSSEFRKDLIEDLNEEGFEDLKHLTAADLKIVDARLALIEKLAPSAMDSVNAEAFAEAKKDLLNMRDRAAGR